MAKNYPKGIDGIYPDGKGTKEIVEQKPKPLPYVLECCEWCGMFNVLAHDKYRNMCKSCGTRYHSYMNNKSYDKAGALKPRRDAAFADTKAYYIRQAALGRQVPLEFR